MPNLSLPAGRQICSTHYRILIVWQSHEEIEMLLGIAKQLSERGLE
jgi:hypothetical protein